MEAAGIRVVAPTGEMHYAELPIILPEVRGAIEQPRGFTLLDVGGDEDGARVLSSLADSFRRYEMLQVVNQRRPFTDTIEGCLKIQAKIEAASRLRVTGLVSNAHLMDETNMDIIMEGAAFTRKVGQAGAGQALRFVAVERRIYGSLPLQELGCPVVAIERLMLPPWRRSEK